ncbi:MAG: NTP transferase domain-containing protein [Sedimentisphaerales bacterium]|nr:NTP transferase domain-containing protein [Sedimentisphaerales bacterium]
MKYAVIMAGGAGQRLWPLSRQDRPKQIIDVFEGKSLLQRCVARLKGVFENDHILVVTNKSYADEVRNHLSELPPENILSEPIGRDTANAIGLAATVLSRKNPDSIMAIFTADHIIEPDEPLQEAVKKAFRFIDNHPQALFTFGIKASSAHTGFGYLKRGEKMLGTPPEDEVYPVVAFKEKPNKSTARQYIRSGDYCWNSGMFVWRIETILNQIDRFLPHNGKLFRAIGDAWNTDRFESTLADKFPQLEGISIDYGVMERSVDVYMCELDCHWIDVGSYQALADTIGVVSQDGNIITNETKCQWIDSGNNIAISDDPKHLIAAIHVEDMIIVHTDDATLICHREETDHLKRLIETLQTEGLGRFV